MTRHIVETDLALYGSGDLALWRRMAVRLHLGGCERCSARVAAYRADRDAIREMAAEMPEGVDWDRLSAEISANIRVGLAAGECVAPRARGRVALTGWHPAALGTAIAAGLVMLLGSAWWLNMPAGETQALGRVWHTIWHGRAPVVVEESGSVVEASPSGVELRENGGALSLSQGSARPVAFSVSVQGSASARYVDADTGQVTVTSVYVQ